MLTDAWPLFGLRLRTEHLVLRMPTDDDVVELLQVAKAGIHPPDEMPFGMAWTSVEGAAFDRGFMQHYWRTRGRLLRRRPGSSTSWSSWTAARSAPSHVEAEEFATFADGPHRVVAGPRAPGPRPRQGDARRGARVRLRRARRAASRRRPPSSTTHASNGVSRALGYEENGLGSLAPQGVARVHPEVPDDGGELAFAPAARPRDRRAGRDPRHVRRRVGRPSLTEARSRRRRRRHRRPTSHRRTRHRPRRRTTTASCRWSRGSTSSRRCRGSPSPRRGCRRCPRPRPSP